MCAQLQGDFKSVLYDGEPNRVQPLAQFHQSTLAHDSSADRIGGTVVSGAGVAAVGVQRRQQRQVEEESRP